MLVSNGWREALAERAQSLVPRDRPFGRSSSLSRLAMNINVVGKYKWRTLPLIVAPEELIGPWDVKAAAEDGLSHSHWLVPFATACCF